MNLRDRVRLWVLPLLICAMAATAAAQDADSTESHSPPIAHVALVDGTASLERDGQTESLITGVPLLPGDRIRTDAGRVEVLFADGSAVHLDRFASFDLLAADLLRLLDGTLCLYVAGARTPNTAVRYQVDAPAASVQTHGPGQYRLEVADGRVDLAVVTGEATLATDVSAVTARAGERVSAFEGQAPSAPTYFNSARWDAFDAWSAERRDGWRGTTSSQYLPTELRAYAGTFERDGVWRHEPSYGYVWYPTVYDDWRPYYDGYWRPYPTWGSVWIASHTWGWPTHHYGRWGFSVSWGWYWIPSRIWGPAWVSWSSAPGYVSWCARGYHGGPVFGLWGLTGSYRGSHMDPWRGWNVVPRHAFGGRHHIPRIAIAGHGLDARTRTGFSPHRQAPRPDVAVSRTWAQHGASGSSPAGRRMEAGSLGPAQRAWSGARPPGQPASGPSSGRRFGGASAGQQGAAEGTAMGNQPRSYPRRNVPGAAVGESERGAAAWGRTGPSSGSGTEWRGPRSGSAGSGNHEPSAASPGASGNPGTRSGRRGSEAAPGASGIPGAGAGPRSRSESSPGASGMPGAGYGSRSRAESPGGTGAPGAVGGARPRTESPGASPGASGQPRGSSGGSSSGSGVRGPGGNPGTSASPGVRRNRDMSAWSPNDTYGASPSRRDTGAASARAYRGSDAASSYPSASSTRTYGEPRSSYSGSRVRPDTSTRSYSPPVSSYSGGSTRRDRSARTDSAPRSSYSGGSSSSSSTPRSYSAPRSASSGGGGSAPRYSAPRSNSSGSSGSGSRYNSGSGGSRAGSRSSGGARGRSRD